MEKEISKGVIAKLENGVVSVEADLKVLALPVIEDIQKKIQSGEIDLVKGTDLDATVANKVLEQLKKVLAA